MANSSTQSRPAKKEVSTLLTFSLTLRISSAPMFICSVPHSLVRVVVVSGPKLYYPFCRCWVDLELLDRAEGEEEVAELG